MVLNCKTEKTNVGYKTDSLALYFKEICKYPVLSSTEERELLNLVKNGSPRKAQAARNKLIECNQRFVISAARKWQTGDNLMDLISEGNLGLIQAIDCFDLNKKQRFLTYAVFWIRKMINDYITNRACTVRVCNATKVYTYVTKARNSFFAKHERMPNKWELKDELKDTFNIHISNADDLDSVDVASIDIHEDGQVEAVVEYGTFSDFNDMTSFNNVEEHINEMHNADLISLLMTRLDKRERYIVKAYYGIGGMQEKGYDVIAKELNICKERVRQILRESLKKMNKCVKKGNYGKD